MPQATTGVYAARDYSGLRGLHGITDEQIEVHLQLYAGYVSRSNKLIEELADLARKKKMDAPGFAEQKRRLGWELNGMRLHEDYFEGLAPGGRGSLSPHDELGTLAVRQYGSVEAWKADLMAVAGMPGIGWAIAYHDPAAQTLLNLWIEQHHEGHPAGWRPVLVCDVWEHAFSVYLKPTERARYLDDFFANVDWDAAARRLR
ncbi:MAG TPA: Fe-Mn family superoxide dismutase [Candidatus Polarisedimenticolia bacterium]|nr:Fe-Mn family superoxide dismutase [Candidatus Polarisedimenticolia bacterium]